MAGCILIKFLNPFGSYRGLLTSRVCVSAYQQQNAGLRMETKEKLKLLKVPEKPKRPLSAYFRFLMHHRPLLQKEHPDWKLTDITKKCGQDWKNIEPKVKEQYLQEYNKELAVFEKKQHDFVSSLTEEQSEALKNARKENLDSKKKRLIRKVYRETHKPKRPIGSFLYFLQEKRTVPKYKHMLLGELLKAVKDEWQNMTQDQKQKYVKMNEADRLRYESEMKVWEAKMIKEGRSDIIRKESNIVTEKPVHLKKPSEKNDH